MLDVRTMVLVLCISNLLLAFGIFLIQRKNATAREMTYWMYGNAASGLGWLLIGLRGTIPLFPSAVLGNAALMLGLALWCSAVAAFRKATFSRLPYVIVALSLVGHWIVLGDDPRPRMVLSSATGAALLLLNTWLLLKTLPAKARGLQRVTACIFGFCGIVALVRALHAAQTQQLMDTFTPNLTQSVAFAAFYLGSVGASFCFLLLTKQRADAELIRLAAYDALTHLYNRRILLELIQSELSRAQRQQIPLALLIFDLDLFKKINDSHGHAAGDHVLQEFARLLLRQRREHDIVGRHGGEEFCMLLPQTTAESARIVAERIRQATEHTEVASSKGMLRFTTSIGLTSLIPDTHTTLESLFEKADLALYEAKRQGRNRVVAVAVEPGSVEPSASTTGM